MSLVVCQAIDDLCGFTNYVYVNPNAKISSQYVRIKDYVFSLKNDIRVTFGTICLNLIQRNICNFSNVAGDSINIADSLKNLPKQDTVYLRLKLEVSNFGKSKTGGIIDYFAFGEYFKKQFDNQFLVIGQQILVMFDNSKYIVKVEDSEFLSATENIESHCTIALLTNTTTICLKSSERSQINFVNIPEAQANMDQQAIIKDFDLEKLGIGGLKKEFGQVFRRAFASRIFPKSIVKKLGIRHVKGVLLHGPPGTGKTLIARKIGEILNCAPPKIVNGPEIFTKWVGGAEENIRKLFADAETDQRNRGEMSQLHLIIFDEFDSICKTRGSTGDNTGVNDNVVNQLLSKIDGVDSLNNVLLIGMTNRKDRIDDAVLRPGRFEVHVEIGLPDEKGRQEILRIHTKGIADSHALADDVNIDDIAHNTKNFSGAELEGLVRAAQSYAFSRHVDFDNPTKIKDADNVQLNMHDFTEALKDVKPAFGQDIDECKMIQRHGIIDYGIEWSHLKDHITNMIKQFKTSKLSCFQLLIHGQVGSGKSSLASFIATQTEFPFIKFVSPASLIGYSELQKCNIIRKAFEDSYKSPLSVIILDDIERLIELAQNGNRYSNTLLQTLMILIKTAPSSGKKLMVISTTSCLKDLESLDITSCFSTEIDAPLMHKDSLSFISRGLGIKWKNDDVERAKDLIHDITICKLILALEMASIDTETGERIIMYDNFVNYI